MKNSKSIFILFSLFFSLITTAQSDKGFYASINSGYNVGTGKANFFQAMILGLANQNETSSTTSTTELVPITLGKGLNVEANLGYMFNKNIGFQLGANYLFGGKIKGSSTSYTGNYTYSEVSAKMIQIKPTLVFRAGYDKLNPYAKVGMVIGSGKITNTQDDKSGTDTSFLTMELDGGMPVGFHASLGTLYKLTDKLSLFGELNLVSLEYAPKKGVITELTENGIDVLPTLTVSEKEVDFIETFTDTGAPTNPNEPSKQAIVPFSFSSFGLNVGLQYHF
jgi:Outer membrane protein beta-barrel domain